MTLNQLALKLWEQLNFESIDASVLSKVLNGQRLFTFKQLEVFCELLKINSTFKKYLFECLLFDISNRSGFKQNFYASNDKSYLNLLTHDLERIKLLEVKGFLKELVDWVDDIVAVNKEKIQTTPFQNTRNLLQDITAKMLRYHIDSVLAVSSKEIILKTNNNTINLLSEYGKNLNNSMYQNLAIYQKANYQYILKKHNKSLKILSKVNSSRLPEFERVNYFRILGSCFALLKLPIEFYRLEKILLEIAKSTSIDNQSSIFEGLAKSHIYLGDMNTAEKYLRQTVEVVNKLKKENGARIKVRNVQLLRTQALFAKQTKDINPAYYRNIKRYSLGVTNQIEFQRFNNEIKAFLID